MSRPGMGTSRPSSSGIAVNATSQPARPRFLFRRMRMWSIVPVSSMWSFARASCLHGCLRIPVFRFSPIADCPKHEIQTVTDWIQGGRPRGLALSSSSVDVRDDASPRADLSVSMPEQWMVPAEGGINWGRRERDKRTFVLPLGNDESLRVQEMRYESSAPQAVHAVSFLADDKGHARYLDEREEGPGHYMTRGCERPTVRGTG